MSRNFLVPPSARDYRRKAVASSDGAKARSTVACESQGSGGCPETANVALMTGVRSGADQASGRMILRLTVAHEGRLLDPWVLDHWCDSGELAVAFADALYGSDIKPHSISSKLGSLDFFFAWLQSTSGITHCHDLTTGLFSAYAVHIDKAKAKDGTPWAAKTKQKRLGDVRSCILWLKASSKWGSKVPHDLRFTSVKWGARQGSHGSQRPPIPVDHLHAILTAATGDVEAIMTRHERGRQLVKEGRSRLRSAAEMTRRKDFDDVAVVLAAIDQWFDGVILNVHDAMAACPALHNSINEVHTAQVVYRQLYPGIRELIPFIVLLTFHTAFNPDTILALKLSNITVSEIFPDQFGCDAGETPARLSAIGEKARGKRNPRRTFPITTDDAFGAYMLIENVKSLTANLRRHATPADQDKLFIFHQTKPGEIRAIGYDKQSISTDNTFQYGLRKFILDHGLPRFSLANIRPTVGDVADQLTEGDIKSVQLLLGHAGSDVSFQHYFTPGAKKRAEEKLAEIQGMRTRWAETAGKRDIREPGLHDSMSSVTPGFHCLDPFDSPMPGQTAGKPCSAWLACAFCPLAAIQEDDGHGLARLIQLESHVKAAVGTIHSDRYDGVYVPMLKKLESWLGKFSEDAHMAASRISYLKPLPELE